VETIVPFFFQVVIIIPTDGHRRLGLFFSGRNYVKIGFGGNVTTGKKRTVVWPAMFFSGFKLQPEKITTGKIKRTVVRPSVGNWKKIRPEKKVQSALVVGWRAKHKTQHTS
jgi:hypothetical protein